jgi:hypothetical protein
MVGNHLQPGATRELEQTGGRTGARFGVVVQATLNFGLFEQKSEINTSNGSSFTDGR